jgi:asparaginyl-tRNA synthetase
MNYFIDKMVSFLSFIQKKWLAFWKNDSLNNSTIELLDSSKTNIMHQYIQDFPQYDGQEVTVKGWVANKRESKTNIFVVFRDGTGFAQCVVNLDAVGEDQFETAKRMTQESAVIFTGTVNKDDRQIGGYELQVKTVEVVHLSKDYPITPKEHGITFLENNRHLWLRSTRQWAIMRIRNQIIQGIHEFFQKDGFVQMDAPLFTGSACEGTTNLFETDFFGDPAYLSQSGQLYGEAMAMAMGKIYTFGPTFRAEKSKTPRHLAEFWMIEPEMAYYTNEMNMDLIERFVRHVVTRVLDNCHRELETLGRNTSSLESVRQPFPRVSYSDSIKILRGEMEVNGKNAITLQEEDLQAAKDSITAATAKIAENEKIIKGGVKKSKRNYLQNQIDRLKQDIKVAEEQVRNIPQWIESAKNFPDGEDFGGSDETVLTRVFDAPVLVYNWPTKIKAFYMKEVDGNPEFVKGVDLLAPEGYGEIVGGSERETDIDILLRKIEEHELDEKDFTWYLDLRRYGAVPHSGFGLGLERIVRWICKLDHIREAIPFPRRFGRLFP